MEKLLNKINPENKVVGGVLFFALITFLICFALFQTGGKRPLRLFQTAENEIVEFKEKVLLTTDGNRAGYSTSYAFLIKLKGHRQPFYHKNENYAKLIDQDKSIRIWYYKPLFQSYYLISQIKQTDRFLLPTYRIEAIINMLLMGISFIVSICCIYIRRKIKV